MTDIKEKVPRTAATEQSTNTYKQNYFIIDNENSQDDRVRQYELDGYSILYYT